MKNLNFSGTAVIDQLAGGDFHGWASIADADVARDASLQNAGLVLSMAGTPVATARRMIARPDVDRIKGQPGIAKGFRIPAAPLLAMAQLSGRGACESLVLEFGSVRLKLAEQAAKLRDLSLFRMLHLAAPGGAFTIADLWFATSNELRMRIEAVKPAFGERPPYRVNIYQPGSGPEVQLNLLSSTQIQEDGIAFLSASLPNPCLPMLLTVSSANGQIVAMDAVLFPSLCRGGLHHDELRAMGGEAGYIADLRAYSMTLFRAFTSGSQDNTAKRISTLDIDTRSCNGGEPLLQAPMLRWLTETHGLTIAIPGDAPERVHLPESLGSQDGAAKRSGTLTLALPAAALPTLAALAFQAPADAGGRTAVPFVTADAGDGRPRWYVSLPTGIGWLAPFQPQGRPLVYPQLSDTGNAGLDGALPEAPMAIRFTAPVSLVDSASLFPAPERLGIERGGTAVSVIIPVRNGAVHATALLASLASQTIAKWLEILIVDNRSGPAERRAIKQAADAIFPGATRILDLDAPFNHSAAINLAAAAATSDTLCVIDSDLILHDPRTLAVLATLAAHQRVGTAACMLLQGTPGKPDSLRYQSAGLFPMGIAFGGKPRITWSEPDCASAIGTATYPVAANSFTLSAFRRDVWIKLGGVADDRLAADHNDTDFGVRALAAGLTNLCTTAVSAFHVGRATRGPDFDGFAPAHIHPVDLDRLLSATTLLRRLG
ncbi:glycosyltransferase family 2 protein [Aestuariivirga sp.]|uniref:glycosyltransferase family 2 protein n=1 Tax=Aestuariivirga sp. TaxID=2650926 RepID=UPI0039E447A0